MTVVKSTVGVRDAKKIRIHEQYEILDWCRKLGCTPEELKEAVRHAGTSIQAVEDYLRNKGNEGVPGTSWDII